MPKPATKPTAATFATLKAKQPRRTSLEVSPDDERTVTVRFQSLGSRAYDALVEAHQAGKRPEAPFNGETFAPALVAACAVEPALSEDEAAQLLEEWSPAEALALFNAALEANTTRATPVTG